VTPPGVGQVRLDNRRVPAGQAFETTDGAHDIMIIHPDYPVYRDRVRVSGAMTDRTFDLARIFSGASQVDVQVGVVPPSEGHLLRLTMNGRTRSFRDFPVLDLSVPAGSWQIEVDIERVNADDAAEPTVDSVVTHPFDAAQRAVLRGSRGTIDLTAGETGSVVPLLVFWSH
jgi:hypothetical protein